ncbi:MAG: fatty acid desaturase [Albidovulum sp.]
MSERRTQIEWPTLALMAGCYLVWAAATRVMADMSLLLAVPVTALCITLHSSLQHEVLHGHPFRSRLLNETLVFLPLGLFFPYGRFRDLHLAHHKDENLTDPYDDPESNFVDPMVWGRLSKGIRLILTMNNTLMGRMVFGPALSVVALVRSDLRAVARADRGIAREWILHGFGLGFLALWLWQTTMPFWAYALSAYGGLSILKIRTFLEHQAHEHARARSVIVEGGRVLPFLFLNNNLHVVHHCKPGVAWYRLPALYAQNRPDWLRRNDGYHYPSYAAIFRQHFLRPKDPVPHPLRKTS